jgi:uncharacterized protein
MKPGWLIGLTALAACVVSGCTADARSRLQLVPLSIQTSTTLVKLKVEIARSEDEQARGLMFRKSLPADGGMIFPQNPPRFASFWMKNTLIPLDMIFIRTDGSIARIQPETVPHSLTPVVSGEPVSAVLELAGGRSAELGISEGDMVRWEDKAGKR